MNIPYLLGTGMMGFGGGGINYNEIAQIHYDRVISDGGTVYSLDKLKTFLKDYYSIRKVTSDTNLLVDPHLLGYKLSSGNLTKLYDLPGIDFEQGTALNMPAFYSWNESDGSYYISPNATVGNGIVQNNVAFSSVSDLDILFKADFQNVNTENNYIYYRRNTSSGDILLYNRNNVIRFYLYLDGSAGTYIPVTSAASLTTGLKWYRCRRNATTGDVSFHYSTDKINWTLISEHTGLLTGNFTDGTKNSSYCSSGDGMSNSCRHKVYEIEVYSGFHDSGGVLIDHFDASLYNPNTSKTTIQNSLGKTLTINRDTNVTGIKGEIIYRNTALFDGVNHRLTRTNSYADSRTNYYDTDYPLGYEVLDDTQELGYSSSTYRLAKSAMLFSVKGADPPTKASAMNSLYSSYFLTPDFFFDTLIELNKIINLEEEIQL